MKTQEDGNEFIITASELKNFILKWYDYVDFEMSDEALQEFLKQEHIKAISNDISVVADLLADILYKNYLAKLMDSSNKEVKTFLERQEWIYAKTMPKTPHWYIVKKKTEDQDIFIEAVYYIQQDGVPEEFEGVTYKYLVLGEYKYWTMGSLPEETTIINRVSNYHKSLNNTEFLN